MIRKGTSADRSSIRSLQRFLDRPAPALMGAVFDAGVGMVLVADMEHATNDIAGYTIALASKSGRDESTLAPTVAYLAELVVTPDRRRQGLGSSLVKAVGERCKGCDQIRVTTRADDQAALAFYQEQGFERVADLTGYFNSETDPVQAEGSDFDDRKYGISQSEPEDGVLLICPLE